jgi:hypothetical protein
LMKIFGVEKISTALEVIWLALYILNLQGKNIKYSKLFD